jgi:hypothetical protein
MSEDPLASVRNHIAEQLTGPVVLWSGDLTDDAGVERLVAAHEVVATYLDPDVHLVVLADHGDRVLFDRLVRFTIELAQTRTWLEWDPIDGVLDLVAARADLHVGDVPDVSPELLAEWIVSQLP